MHPIFAIKNQSKINCTEKNNEEDLLEITLENLELKNNYDNIHFNDQKKAISSAPISVINPGNSFDGLNLFVLSVFNFLENPPYQSYLLVTNMEGAIISQLYIGSTNEIPYGSARFFNSTTAIVEGINTLFLWNFYDNSRFDLNFRTHHDVTYNPNHNSFFTFSRKNVTISDELYIFDVIKEYSIEGNLLWELSTESFIPHTQWCSFHDMLQAGKSITHANAIYFDPYENVLYVNLRNQNTFYKISYLTKEVLWSVGEYGDFNLFDQYGILKENLFYHAHALEKIDSNTFILFDNDFHNQTSFPYLQTRIIEIKIDETKKIANISWLWNPPFGYCTEMWGDADRLPNGNRLGTFGVINPFENQYRTRLTELTPEGSISWEMRFKSSTYIRYHIYSAERFLLNPYLSIPEDFSEYVGNNISVDWYTAYNFKTSNNIIGSYKIYLNEALIENGALNFSNYWKLSKYTTNLGKMTVGVHNFTIEVIDDAGHSTVKSLNITVTPFYINRNGPENIEKNQNNTVVQWTGETINPLILNITINGTLNSSQSWNGELVELDLNSLEIGIHSISLVLVNNSNVIYNDTFWSNVYPLENPLFIDSPDNLVIKWGDECLLNWTIQDSTPSKWEIYINNTLFQTEQWYSQYYELEWLFPPLDEGMYNCTLVLYDCASQTSSDFFWLTIIPPSPPIISEYPSQMNFQYGVGEISLSWEIHGGKNYTLWIDGLKSYEGLVINNAILIEESNWNLQIWRPGEHNLLLQVSDFLGYITSGQLSLFVWLNLGDEYVDDYIPYVSELYENGENAIGAPDENYTKLVLGYANGYITLDMGYQEEVIDRAGKDFIVVGGIGTYTVWVSNDPLIPFVFLGSGSGIQYFDLATVSFHQARYIRIEYAAGSFVELDAIVALHYNQPEWDDDPPVIIGPDDFWVWENQAEIFIRWNVSDQLPNNYSILVNGEIFISNSWDGSDITCNISTFGMRELNVTLIVFDLMSLSAEDIIRIEIREITNINRILKFTLIPIASVLVAATVTWTILSFLKKRKIR